MRGLEGKGYYSEEKGKTQSETRKKNYNKRKKKLKQRDTKTPNEVRPETSVTCVE